MSSYQSLPAGGVGVAHQAGGGRVGDHSLNAPDPLMAQPRDYDVDETIGQQLAVYFTQLYGECTARTHSRTRMMRGTVCGDQPCGRGSGCGWDAVDLF